MYVINFTDPSKQTRSGNRGSFIMPTGTTNGPNSPLTTSLSSDSQSAESSLLIYGKDVPDYGERIGENFIQMLENFSSPIPPSYPINGQLWYKTGESFLIVGQNLANETVVISGNHLSLINDIINEDFTINGEVNPFGSIRIINVDGQSVIETEPVNVYLNNSGNTEIQFIQGTFNNVTSVIANKHYITTVGNHRQLLVYNDGTLYGTAPEWVSIDATIVHDEEPVFAQDGQLWIDTSAAPPKVRIKINGNFNDGLLPLEGGELTGKVYYPSTESVTDDLELVPKQFVDSSILDVTQANDSRFNDIENTLDAHDVRIQSNTDDIANLQTTVSNNYNNLDSRVTTNTTDIATIEDQLEDVINSGGGTITGDLTFQFQDNIDSAGISWVGDPDESYNGYNLNVFTLADTSSNSVIHKAVFGGIGTSNNSAFDLRYRSENDIEDTIIFSGRKSALLVQNPVYEQNPATLPIGDPASAGNKYQTKDEVDQTITDLGNILIGDTNQLWEASTFTLTLNGINNSINVDLSHTHTSEDFVVTYEHSDFSENQKLPYPDNDPVTISSAIRNLDILTPGLVSPDFVTGAHGIDLLSISASDDTNTTVTVDLAEFEDIAPVAGDRAVIYSAETTGRFGVLYSSSTSGNITGTSFTGLENNSTEYTLSIQIDFEPLNLFEITEQGQNLQTYQDVVDWLNGEFGSVATASIDNGNFYITSSTSGVISSVNMIDDGLFINTSAFSDATPPDLEEILGLPAEPVLDTTVVGYQVSGSDAIVEIQTSFTAQDALNFNSLGLSNIAASSTAFTTLHQIESTYAPQLYGVGSTDATSPFATIGDVNVTSFYAYAPSVADLPDNFSSGGGDVHTLTLNGTTSDDNIQFAIQDNNINVRSKTSSTTSDWSRVFTSTDVSHDLTENDGKIELPDSSQNDTLQGKPVFKWLSGTLDTTDVAYNLSNVDFRSSVDIGTEDTDISGVFSSPDGTRLFVTGANSNTLYQYDMSTPWSLSTISLNGSFDLSSENINPRGLFIGDDGQKLYILDSGNDRVFQYTLGTAWDISTAVYDTVSLSVVSEDSQPYDLFFSTTGDKLFIAGSSSSTIYQYSVGTPWDISTATYDTVSFDISAEETFVQGLSFSSDGLNMYVVGVNSDAFVQYSLTSAWDISAVTFESETGFGTVEQGPTGMFISADGTRVFLSGVGIPGSTSGFVHQFDVRAQETVDLSAETSTILQTIVSSTDSKVSFGSEHSGSDVHVNASGEGAAQYNLLVIMIG